MAVVDLYFGPNIESGVGYPVPPDGLGGHLCVAVNTMAVAAADSDGSVYRLFANMSENAVPVKIEFINTAITGGTDYDLVLRKPNGGPAFVEGDAQIQENAIDFSAAHGLTAPLVIHFPSISGGATLGSAAPMYERKIVEFRNALETEETVEETSFDLCLRGNTVGTAAGLITAVLYYVRRA